MSGYKPTICIDFDGVIHQYSDGWRGGVIYDKMVPGFVAWAAAANAKFNLVIYSSRSKDPGGIALMKTWFHRELAERFLPNEIDYFLSIFTFAHEKPPAWLTIDDRALQFKGDWVDPALSVEGMLNYRPWNNTGGL